MTVAPPNPHALPMNGPGPPPSGLNRLAAGPARHWRRAVRRLGLAGGLCGVGWMAAAALPDASFLAIDDIVVRGAARLSDGEVTALVSGLRGASILSVDLDDYRRRLSASPWVFSGALRRRLPSTVEVHVTERRPIALARFGGRLFLLDASGVIVDAYGPRFAAFDFPIVDGLGGGEPAAENVDPKRMGLAVRLLAALAGQPDVLAAVSQIDVADPDDAVVLLDDDVALLRLGRERFLARLRLYAEMAPLLRESVRDIDEVDLRFDPRVYVRSGAEAVGDGAAGSGPRGHVRSGN